MRMLLLATLLITACTTTEAPVASYRARGEVLPPPVAVYQGPVTMGSSIVALKTMIKQSGPVYRLYINSRGGDLNAAKLVTEYFNRLRAKGARIDCFAGPEIMSAAYYIFLHCDRRYVTMDTILFPHKIHIYFNEPVLPRTLIEVGMATEEEQMDWDERAREITGMNPSDYKEFRDSDDNMWSMDKVLKKSTKSWLIVVPAYNFRLK